MSMTKRRLQSRVTMRRAAKARGCFLAESFASMWTCAATHWTRRAAWATRSSTFHSGTASTHTGPCEYMRPYCCVRRATPTIIVPHRNPQSTIPGTLQRCRLQRESGVHLREFEVSLAALCTGNLQPPCMLSSYAELSRRCMDCSRRSASLTAWEGA